MKNLFCLILAASFWASGFPAMAVAVDLNETGGTEKKAPKKDGKKNENQAIEPVQFPLATRIEPLQKGSDSLQKIRNQMIVAYQKDKAADANVAADKLKAEEKANSYDKAIAIQIKKVMLSKTDPESKEIVPLIEEILELNSLDNNTHYSFMLELAQRYLLAQDYEDALALTSKFLLETKAETEAPLIVRGNSLYRLGKLQESITVLEKVRVLNPANTPVLQMLSRAYSETGQTQKASEISKNIVQSSGNDRASLVNLVINYRDSKDFAAAADVIADLRARKELVEERDYLVAINIYTAMKNREKDTISVVEEGLQKGALTGSASIYNILAEAYYYSDHDNNIKKAIDAWVKAAPLAKDGASYLNLAIVQCQEEMWAACKESAKAAINKGGINAADAKKQMAVADAAMNQAK